MFSASYAMIFYGLLYFSIVTVYGVKDVPRAIGVIQPILLFFVFGISRLFARYLFIGIHKRKEKMSLKPRALIYGAGSAGLQLESVLAKSYEMNVVGFLDDDKSLHGQVSQGKSIFSPQDLGYLIASKQVSHVLLAIPSTNRNMRLQILRNIEEHKVIVRTLPSISELVEGRVTTSDVRDLDIDDLLARDQVVPDYKLLDKNINSKVVLVTGAGGSIGSELCRQIIKSNPEKVLLVDISEYALYKIHAELEEISIKTNSDDNIKIIPLLASVQDDNRMMEILSTWKPDTLYHAAAYKHVPLVEQNVCEGIKNNVFGTLIITQAAIKNDVSNVVLISSDKAVRPTNVMGASKRLAELCLQALFADSKTHKTKLSMVRFGNVLDSSGSVIPKFKKQILKGGPVTLTHSEVTRYFMTIPEAAQLVIQASAMTEGCDVFLLEMGKPVKIKDLIKRIIALSGLSIQDENNPDGDIKILITGLRPGEKLYEELLLGDNPQPTKHTKIKRAQDPFIPWHQLESELNYLKVLVHQKKTKEVLNILQKLVTGYKPTDKIVDQVFTQQVNLGNIKK